MKNLIETICLIFVVICIIGLIVSVAINNIATFILSALFMMTFWGIALVDISRK